MKTKILAIFLAALLILFVFCACKKNVPDDGPVMPEGDITEIWFDDTIRAFYPKELSDMFFSKIYLYGEVETDQPVIFLCSEKLTEISLCAFDGTVGEVLHTVEEMLPMEAIILQEELSEVPAFAISFKDEKGNLHSYSVARNGDSVALEQLK